MSIKEVIEQIVYVDGYFDDELYYIKTNLGYWYFAVHYSHPFPIEIRYTPVSSSETKIKYDWLKVGEEWIPNREINDWEEIEKIDKNDFNQILEETGETE